MSKAIVAQDVGPRTGSDTTLPGYCLPNYPLESALLSA